MWSFTSRPQIDSEDVKGQAILKTVQGRTPSQLSSPTPAATTTVTTVSVVGNPDEEKKLKSLKKKLTQIETLKKKRDQGEKLEQNQVCMIKKNQSVNASWGKTEAHLIKKLIAKPKIFRKEPLGKLLHLILDLIKCTFFSNSWVIDLFTDCH